MASPDDNGLPTDEESRALEIFEDRLVAAVEPDEQSILCAVLTCNGRREFVLQTVDVKGFLARLTAMPQEVERYPIEIHHNPDQSWSYFDEVTRAA
jgi:hypothetical protein